MMATLTIRTRANALRYIAPFASDLVTPLSMLSARIENSTAPTANSQTVQTIVKSQNIVLNVMSCDPETETE